MLKYLWLNNVDFKSIFHTWVIFRLGRLISPNPVIPHPPPLRHRFLWRPVLGTRRATMIYSGVYGSCLCARKPRRARLQSRERRRHASNRRKVVVKGDVTLFVHAERSHHRVASRPSDHSSGRRVYVLSTIRMSPCAARRVSRRVHKTGLRPSELWFTQNLILFVCLIVIPKVINTSLVVFQQIEQ